MGVGGMGGQQKPKPNRKKLCNTNKKFTMLEWIKPFVRQDPLRFTQFNGDKSVNFGFKTLVLNNPGCYHTALRKNQITCHKVQIYSCSDCFRRWLHCLAFLAGCKEGARLTHLYTTLLSDVLLKRAVPHPLHIGLCGPLGRWRGPVVSKDRLVGRTEQGG